MSGDGRGAAASRRAALREIAVVAGLAMAAVWIIPSQTASGPVLGLKPAMLPTFCALAVLAIALFALVARLWHPEPLQLARSAPFWPAALIAAVAIAGVLMLQVLGPVVCGLVVVSLGLTVLGEKRKRIVLSTLAGTALVLAITFQPWR